MEADSPHRQRFEPNGASLEATSERDPVQATAISSTGASARFEFEAGRGNEGTKILMVEWNDESEGAKKSGRDWEVSWEGKRTVVSERDGAEGKTHRLYFLLPPGATIPPIVKIAQTGGTTMQTNPLPAIFPPELGASARTAGKKGVLHTKWGKRRLTVLEKEIEREMKTNGEGIGLEMARQEKLWIEENFGIGGRSIPDSEPLTPSSPRSPGGGRLTEKLRGLKLGTTTADLIGRSTVDPVKPSANPLSPDAGDVAVSSFSLFHGGAARPTPRAVAQNPPSHVLAQQAESHGNSRMSSLDAVAGGSVTKTDDNDTEDGLFAVMVSPRSPEMTKSPFSLTTSETVPWR